MEAQLIEAEKSFQTATEAFIQLTNDLQHSEQTKMEHGELERFIAERQREVSRLLFQESIDMRGNGDVGQKVEGSDGVKRTHKREGIRGLKTIFGEISIIRQGYGLPGTNSLFPLDGSLNLPGASYSHGLQRELGSSVVNMSFEEAIKSTERLSGVLIPKRQAEELSRNLAEDFDLFYERRLLDPDVLREIEKRPILVMTTDGKGVVVRHEDLRDVTRKRAQESQKKMGTRLSRGEKKNRKRIAQVSSVYSIDRYKRTPEQIVKEEETLSPAPRPVGKRVWASLEKDQEISIESMFDEAERRDPNHEKEWVVLVDGQSAQLERINAEADRRGIEVTIIADIIHVLEYVWKAARVLVGETGLEVEAWVKERLLEILRGKAKSVASGIRRSATFRGLSSTERGPVDRCADYLHNLADHIQYNEYLRQGYPIATGVIEGACRHLIKDRMDITGARWSIDGAEAILKLRSLHISGDLDEYWEFHEAELLERNHAEKYKKPALLGKIGLRVVK